jgi:ABC-2 type transport system ATP-binding protein
MASKSAPIIRTEKLGKTFAVRGKHAVEAVRAIDLEVAGGEIFGLLGPNGAGKTTAMRILCTLLRPTGGRASVVGFDVAAQPREVRLHIGYVGQKGGLEQEATGRENLMLQALLYHMTGDGARARVGALIDRLGLSSFAERKTATYSGGQRRLFDLATGIVHAPELLFLDEPTTGLDPQSRGRVWDEVRSVHDEGTTIFLTTHYLEEADVLCDRVAIVDRGAIVALGTPAELKKQVAGDSLSFTYDTASEVESAAALLRREPLILDARVTGTTLHVHVDDGDEALPVVMRLLGRAHVPPRTVHLSRPSLDDVFLKLTGRTLREPEAAAEMPPHA